MQTPSKILVRSPNWIGDQILAYPFFYYLRQGFPKAHITVACSPWVRSIQFKKLVNEVIVLPPTLDDRWFSRLDAIEKGADILRPSGPWDLGISLPNSFSAAWLLFRSSVKVRRGYSVDGRGFLLSDRVRWDKKNVLHRSEAYVRLLPRSCWPRKPVSEFWGILPENDLDPGIPGVLPYFDAEKEWPDAEPVDPLETPYWILAPGSTAESRRWPAERFAAFARRVYQETGWTGVIIGGPAEIPIANRLSEDPSLHLIDWAAKGAVTSYWKVFRHAQFSICNDSGLAHVASLCGSPVQVVWGAGNPNRTEPIGPGKVQVILNPVECWPCEKNACSQRVEKKLQCLKGIEDEAVWKEIKSGIQFKSQKL
jgi:heptosyltransferase-2